MGKCFSRIKACLLELNATYAPGDVLNIKLEWEVSSPSKLEVLLGWYADTGDDQDVLVHCNETIILESLIGEKQISITLPIGPLTYNGSLFRTQWLAEVKNCSTNDLIQIPFELRRLE